MSRLPVNPDELARCAEKYRQISKMIDILNQGESQLRVSGHDGTMNTEVCLTIKAGDWLSDKLEEILLLAAQKARTDMQSLIVAGDYRK